MAACGRAGSDTQAEWLLQEMREQGVTPNRISYSAAMFALGKAGRLPDVSFEMLMRSPPYDFFSLKKKKKLLLSADW